jgi:tetratricopeptide (TPR) repeat protein
MKEENYIYISGQENYPSLDTLNKYVRGDLPEEEMVEIGKMVENDPFLADVLEGFNEVGDVAKVNLSVGRIKDHSQKRLYSRLKKRENLSKRQSRVAPQKYTQLIMATAAAIALLFVTVFVVNRLEFNDPNVTQIAESSPIEPNSELSESSLEEPSPTLVPPIDSVRTDKTEEVLFSERKPITKETKKALTKTDEINETRKDIGGDLIAEEELSERVITQSTQTGLTTKPDPRARPTVRKEELQSDIALDDELTEEARLEEAEKLAAEREEKVREEAQAMERKMISNDLERQKDERALAMMKLENMEQTDTAEYMSEKEVNNIPLRPEGPVLIPRDSRLTAKRKQKAKEKVEYLPPQQAPLLTDEQIMMGKYQKNVALAEMMTEADRLYKEGSYQAALNNVYEVLRADPENMMANYYAGGCYFAMQEYKSATSFLKEVAKSPDSKFKDDARWLLAQAHMKRNKFRNAESELKILIEEETKYAGQAAELIKKLNE